MNYRSSLQSETILHGTGSLPLQWWQAHYCVDYHFFSSWHSTYFRVNVRPVICNNGPNGHLFYVGGDLMMRRGMLPIIMLPDGDLCIALHLVPFWILTIWGSVHIYVIESRHGSDKCGIGQWPPAGTITSSGHSSHLPNDTTMPIVM